MVVKITPPDGDLQQLAQVCRGSRPAPASAAAAPCSAANVPKSWSSRSLRSVRTTSVGFSIAGCRIDLAGIERHRQALARPLRVPDHADPPVARAARRLRPFRQPRCCTAWNWW